MRSLAACTLGLHATRTTPWNLIPRFGHQVTAYSISRCREKHALKAPGQFVFRFRSPCQNDTFQRRTQRRAIFISTVLTPPLVFSGLLLGLWTYKCMMMVMFQNRIIYMPSLPPFARSEKIEDYAAICMPVEWQQDYISSSDGTKLAICIGQVSRSKDIKGSRHVVICYFQGNGGSLPPRLPQLSHFLKLLHVQDRTFDSQVRYSIVALSYRGYWTSSGRASQAGIELDAQALLQWVRSTFDHDDGSLSIVLWGQSIGAGVASTALATYLKNEHQKTPVVGLILETPFVSIASILVALYPEKWLPYRYLSPFLWNHWDSEAALGRIGKSPERPRVLLLSAEKDEIVPRAQTERLEYICVQAGLETSNHEVRGSLHTEATSRPSGQQAIVNFLRGTGETANSKASRSRLLKHSG